MTVEFAPKTDEAIDLARVEEIVEELGKGRGAVIPILQAIQEQYRYLPQSALRRVCELTEIRPADIVGVSTFYSQFRHKPVGRHLISVCNGTACHVKGAERVYDSICRHLGLANGVDTDKDGTFTVQKVSCLGCCTLAPVMQIDGITYGHLDSSTVGNAIGDFLELERRSAVPDRFEPGADGKTAGEIRIGVGSCCVAGGSLDVCQALEETVRDMRAPVVVKRVGCVGMCHNTPLVEVQANGQNSFYSKVTPETARKVVRTHFAPKGLGRKLQLGISNAVEHLLTDEVWEPVSRYELDMRDAPACAFLGRQVHIATEHSGSINPTDIEEYRSHGGFSALQAALNGKPSDIIETIARSGLRGRGGAGFPSGAKWQTVANTPGETKYIVCNGDEGDPGAFMDRMILESYPYRVLEGIALAAYAVGANEGFLYVRAEYPLAVRRLREAMAKCEEQGILGGNIFGTGFDLKLTLMEGAGAFVCGEESALLQSIEGKRGMPKLRPPYPAECGLWGQPTLVNNVETYALVPWIIREGAEAFAKLGTQTSKGTKVFALAGKVKRGGLIEVPMGITVREIVEEVGGGVADDKRLKAVQIGGPSGGCIPASMCDTPIDYEALKAAGAIMGSGGLVVIDDGDCMVDIARYFLEFTQRESCGKCTFCRVGTRRMLDVLERICTGHGKRGDLENLEQLALQVKQSSLCGLGGTAPNPILSTLKHYRDEYEAHLRGVCPAGKCKALIEYHVTDNCIGCTICSQRCPGDAIAFTPYQKHTIDQDKCIKCGTCVSVCPKDAVMVKSEGNTANA